MHDKRFTCNHANAERVFQFSARTAGMIRTGFPLHGRKTASKLPAMRAGDGNRFASQPEVKNENRRAANPAAFTNEEINGPEKCEPKYPTPPIRLQAVPPSSSTSPQTAKSEL
jgi:hypothetical protein